MLTPYMNSVPAVIAKASAIYNPIIYAITHPKYRYKVQHNDVFCFWSFLHTLLCKTGLSNVTLQPPYPETLSSVQASYHRHCWKQASGHKHGRESRKHFLKQVFIFFPFFQTIMPYILQLEPLACLYDLESNSDCTLGSI